MNVYPTSGALLPLEAHALSKNDPERNWSTCAPQRVD